jgi:DNA-directed RNA polymerase specialized sigma24 family protein
MEVLTLRYYKPVYAFVYRHAGNKETAYDLTQDIFIKTIQRIGSYSGKGTEVAEVTRVSVPTVKSRLKQGLNKLAGLMKRGEDDERTKSGTTRSGP